jgi:hypothetical protein
MFRLHGDDLDESLTPFTIYPIESEASRAMAMAFGIPIAVASQSPYYTVGGAWDIGVPAKRRINDRCHGEAAMKVISMILHAAADDRHRPRNPQDRLWL